MNNRVQQRAQARERALHTQRVTTEYLQHVLEVSRQTMARTQKILEEIEGTTERRQVQVRVDDLLDALLTILREEGIDGAELLLKHAGFLAKATGNSRKEWVAFARRFDDDMNASVVIELNQRLDPPIKITDMGGTDPLGDRRVIRQLVS